MYKYLVLLFALTQLCHTVNAQGPLSKEEKKRIKSELKNYMKDPEIYKQTMDRYNQIIDSGKATLAAKEARIYKLTHDISDLKIKEDELKAAVATCENKPAPKCAECPCSGTIPNTGVYYKVQVGSVQTYNEKAFAEAKGLVVEKVGNSNHYVFSYFDSREDAVAFGEELKKLGMENTSVVRYENGVRVKPTERKPVLRISEDAPPLQPRSKGKTTKKATKRKK